MHIKSFDQVACQSYTHAVVLHSIAQQEFEVCIGTRIEKP